MTKPPAFRKPTYREFWPHYLEAHQDARSRALHYLGTCCGLVLLVLATMRRDWRLAAFAFIPGYGLAWLGHAAFERNRPATFRHPLWSLYSDLRMFALWLGGRLPSELARAKEAAPVKDEDV